MVEAFRKLRSHLIPLLPNFIDESFPVDESFIRGINFSDISPWPDEIYYTVEFQILMQKGIPFERQAYLHDVYDGFAQEYKKIPSEVLLETNLRAAIELMYLGPWSGFSVEKITNALNLFREEIEAGVKIPRSPIMHCLEPGTSWRWRQPLWQSGRFQGFLTVLMGGDISRLRKNLDETLGYLSEIGDLIRQTLEQQREAYAASHLLAWRRTRTGDFRDAVQKYCEILLAPHRIVDLSVSETPSAANGGPDNNGSPTYLFQNTDGPATGFIIRERIIGYDISLEVELYDEDRRSVCELMKIYMDAQLRRITTILEEAALPSVASKAPPGEVREMVQQRAQDLLEENRGERLNNKLYCVCFICLAILQKENEPKVQIKGNLKDRLQFELYDGYDITRKNQWNEHETLKTDKHGRPKTMPLSQLCDDRAINFVQDRLGNVRLQRGHDLITVEFHAGHDGNGSTDTLSPTDNGH